jgi:hypothetical protein
VVLQAQPVGNIGDGDQSPWRSACDLQHKLMLLGLQAGFDGTLLAEVEEFTEFVTECSQGLEPVEFRNGRA